MTLEEQTRSGIGYLESTLLPAQRGDVLEIDEVWSFVGNENVGNKHSRVWIWLALCRRTRQIAAWWYGNRQALSCTQLWRKIPQSYRDCFCYGDLWSAYSKILPQEQHPAYPKSEGQINHIERFNLTLLRSVAQLVRKTLSFSKRMLPHLRAIRHFLISYNRRKAKEYSRKGSIVQ